MLRSSARFAPSTLASISTLANEKFWFLWESGTRTFEQIKKQNALMIEQRGAPAAIWLAGAPLFASGNGSVDDEVCLLQGGQDERDEDELGDDAGDEEQKGPEIDKDPQVKLIS